MLSDVSNPTHIRSISGEVAFDKIVVNRWPWCFAATALLHRRRGDLMLTAQAMHPVLRHDIAEHEKFVGDEPVSELWVVAMNIEDRVDELGVGTIAIRARIFPPLVKALRREAEHST